MTIDLGCGRQKRGDVGIDARPGPGVDLVCQVGFEPIPLPDGIADAVFAFDFLEHLPAVAPWRDAAGGWHLHYPRIACLRDVYRLLRPGGRFVSWTPTALPAWAQDPTHTAPPWVPETWDYFCGRHPGAATADIDFAFRLVLRQVCATHLLVVVERPAVGS